MAQAASILGQLPSSTSTSTTARNLLNSLCIPLYNMDNVLVIFFHLSLVLFLFLSLSQLPLYRPGSLSISLSLSTPLPIVMPLYLSPCLLTGVNLQKTDSMETNCKTESNRHYQAEESDTSNITLPEGFEVCFSGTLTASGSGTRARSERLGLFHVSFLNTFPYKSPLFSI